jgi:hypothetical protein
MRKASVRRRLGVNIGSNTDGNYGDDKFVAVSATPNLGTFIVVHAMFIVSDRTTRSHLLRFQKY